MTVSQGYKKIYGNDCQGGVDLEPLRVRCGNPGEMKYILLGVLIGLLIWLGFKGEWFESYK